MLSKEKFIKQSLELNLFFLRIMKEHLVFVGASLTPKSHNYLNHANMLKLQLDDLLRKTIKLSKGVVEPKTGNTGEIVTNYTLEAEKFTEFYTGIDINTNTTEMELALEDYSGCKSMHKLSEEVFYLNQQIIPVVNETAKLKNTIKTNVLRCKMFTGSYPLLLDHILREAMFYLRMLGRLQEGIETDINREIIAQEAFWNRIMGEHAKFIRGFLDPTEEELFDTANKFGKQFDKLTKEALSMHDNAMSLSQLSNITEDSREATKKIRDFKMQGTEGILNCQIKSIILPLLGDHVLREANHYLRLLNNYDKLV
ncbi:DUF2935 domain-containing protein [Clostridium sp. UBA4548]|uniref:DUF2935 domain-containing protein n=1 Tax=Clostridium sp. UBA4548 TaxID=1946361 RepID=UPI0025C0C1DF|nr:DUF2935 domain-containing protein [Clostridium sp. UBA4548]